MSSAIRAVIFDVGGVLVRTFDQSGRASWEHRLGLPPGGAEAIVLNSDAGRLMQLGTISETALWEWVREKLRLGDDLDAFRRDFWRGDAVDASLVALVRRLRPRYRTAILSNAGDGLLETLERYGLRREFEVIVGSAYEGVMKPDPAIYERVLARLDCTADEAVFIDDAPANVAAAAALGIHALHFRPTLDLARELAALGVELAPPPAGAPDAI